MIKYVYSTKNKLSGNFNAPQLQDFPKDNAAEVFTISAREAKAAKDQLKELEVYYLGTFDSKTGAFTCEQEYILDLGSVIYDEQDGSKKES